MNTHSFSYFSSGSVRDVATTRNSIGSSLGSIIATGTVEHTVGSVVLAFAQQVLKTRVAVHTVAAAAAAGTLFLAFCRQVRTECLSGSGCFSPRLPS